MQIYGITKETLKIRHNGRSIKLHGYDFFGCSGEVEESLINAATILFRKIEPRFGGIFGFPRQFFGPPQRPHTGWLGAVVIERPYLPTLTLDASEGLEQVVPEQAKKLLGFLQKKDGAWTILPEYIEHYDEPYGTTRRVQFHKISRLRKGRITVTEEFFTTDGWLPASEFGLNLAMRGEIEVNRLLNTAVPITEI